VLVSENNKKTAAATTITTVQQYNQLHFQAINCNSHEHPEMIQKHK